MRRALSTLLLALALVPAAAASEEALTRDAERGPVSATVSLRPAEPRIGDVLELRVEVRAESGVELLMPEFGEALDRFAIVDFVPEESLAPDGSTVAVQRYRLQPSRSGPQSIPSLLIEFVDRRPGRAPAPEGEDAFELLTERLDFEVASVLPEDAPLELRPARGALPPLAPPGRPPWLWGGLALLALAGVAPLALRAQRRWSAQRLRRSASEIARAELDELLYGSRPRTPAEMDAFYVKLSGIVRRYLENRFSLHAPELTTEEFLEAMRSSPELVRSHRQLLRDFLSGADLVKFAGFQPGAEDVEESIRKARLFLDETREDAARGAPFPAGAEAAAP